MKKLIPLIALTLLAGCGNNSTSNTENQSPAADQSAPANPSTSEPAPSPAAPGETNSNPAAETVTNSPATNSGLTPPNGAAGAN